MGEAEEGGAGSTHMDPKGSCLHNHWDQCVIYVEITEIFTFLEPALPQLQPGLNTPRDRAGLSAGGSQVCAGQDGPYSPGYQPVPEAQPLAHKGDPAQTYLLTS